MLGDARGRELPGAVLVQDWVKGAVEASRVCMSNESFCLKSKLKPGNPK